MWDLESNQSFPYEMIPPRKVWQSSLFCEQKGKKETIFLTKRDIETESHTTDKFSVEREIWNAFRDERKVLQ